MQNTSTHLLSARRREDRTRDRAREQAGAYERREAWLVAAAAAGDDGDLGRAGGLAVDDFVGDVALQRGVCVGEGEEGGGDEVGWVVDEVFGW